MTNEKLSLSDLIDSEAHARELYKNEVTKIDMAYNAVCNNMVDELQAASLVKVGDRVRITKGFTYAGRKAIVQDIGFFHANDYLQRFRDAAARVVLLKKDGTESKITTIASLVNLRKI